MKKKDEEKNLMFVNEIEVFFINTINYPKKL